jgi:predicted protein tyrosine phosphatase
MNILFLCAANRLRSPTAEQIFADHPQLETDSAGLNADADVRLSVEQGKWADIIFAMEASHKKKLQQQFRKPERQAGGRIGHSRQVRLHAKRTDRIVAAQSRTVLAIESKFCVSNCWQSQ